MATRAALAEAVVGAPVCSGDVDILAPVPWQRRINRVIGPATGFEITRVRRRPARPRRGARGIDVGPNERLLVAPVFIFASIRSGSTLLRMLLGSHSQLHAPHELHLRDLNVRLYSEYAVQAMAEIGLDESTLEYLLWDRVLHRELQESRKSHIVNKTPSDAFIWRRIAECWPDARFVFLLRHPLAIARSRQGASRREAPDDNVTKVLRFMDAVEQARQNLDGHTVRYEDLTADPEGETRRLCEFLALEWERGMLDYGRFDHGKYTPGLGDWGERIRSGQIQPAPALPSDDEIPEALRAIAEAWGYAGQPTRSG